MESVCLQEKYAPHNACFGCGPANAKGLRIRSFPKNDNEAIATWKAESFHEAFPGVLSGGIIGTLLDCHSNWTAAWHLMQKQKLAHPPCTVTAQFSVTLKRPTSTDEPIDLIAKVVDSTQDKVTVHAELSVQGIVCATCEGQFVAIKPGHPAYHRW